MHVILLYDACSVYANTATFRLMQEFDIGPLGDWQGTAKVVVKSVGSAKIIKLRSYGFHSKYASICGQKNKEERLHTWVKN
ncbi:hypothetical protein Y032_0475g2137 [Ancylostoma ceylanicum]|uniref:Uncharacterized protein n=1 Tax=Ancylostoma ceylanicum TaxID=53326 RepID=A0A016WWP0_9BILA|nr:hypothetical protein Y032_0475g2137 [Ancylostoma ceylanicum]